MIKNLRAATDTLMELALIYGAILLVASTLFMLIEGQPFITSLYWAGTTATSTGYGDIVPKSFLGMGLAFLLQHVAIFVIAPLIIVRLHQHMNEDRHIWTDEEQVTLFNNLTKISDRQIYLEQLIKDTKK
jgi:voltage-gated potassium channel